MAGGRPPIYDANFHPDEIIRLMKEEGLTDVEVACRWDIVVETLWEWRQSHPEFSKASTRARQYRKAWWMEKGRQGLLTSDGEKFDSRLFGMMMKYDGINMDERTVALPELIACKTFAEKSDCILNALAVERINITEANGIVDIIGKTAKIDEITELRRMLEEVQERQKAGG
jgi:transposase-like protein